MYQINKRILADLSSMELCVLFFWAYTGAIATSNEKKMCNFYHLSSNEYAKISHKLRSEGLMLVIKLMQNMKVRVLFKPKSQLKNKIRDTYIDLYRKFKRENPTDKTYTRTKLQQNIRNVLSVGRISIDDVLLRQSTYNP